MSRLVSYLKGGLATTANVLAYAATDGRFVLLEGRILGRTFRNWALRFANVPRRYARPTTEAEIIDLVKRSGRVRVVGSGHSFNGGILSEDTLVSLDDYAGPIRIDLATNQITVRAGTRVRDIVRLMLEHDLAFTALPSHDAQSIGGILSTNVHGTGRDWGFVAESVVALTIIDGTGTVRNCRPGEDLFRAAIGGIGAVGIIATVTLQGVARFTIDQQTSVREVTWVREHLTELMAAHDHVGLYLFPYSDHCQLNTWDRTQRPKTPGGELKEFLNISADALLAAWVGNLLAYTGLLPLGRRWSRVAYLIRRGTSLVLESDNAHNRTLYHLHQELEFTIPFEQTFEICDRLMALYQRLGPSGLPYLLLEVRFTPPHDDSLIGAGKDYRCTWIDLICNDSDGYLTFYAAAAEMIKEIGGRPHLGKHCDGFDGTYLEQLYGDDYRRFQRLVTQHDPNGRFANAFTNRMFATPVTRSDDVAV